MKEHEGKHEGAFLAGLPLMNARERLLHVPFMGLHSLHGEL
jgi:hypothetical protein